MYLTTDHKRIDYDIADGFAAVLAEIEAPPATVERLVNVVQPHLDELRAVRERMHQLSRGAQEAWDELEAAKKRISELEGELEQR